jgi:hypothetical protein
MCTRHYEWNRQIQIPYGRKINFLMLIGKCLLFAKYKKEKENATIERIRDIDGFHRK